MDTTTILFRLIQSLSIAQSAAEKARTSAFVAEKPFQAAVEEGQWVAYRKAIAMVNEAMGRYDEENK